jgi:hypothetical protein
MKKINESAMLEISGGSRITAILGGAACGGIAALSGLITFGVAAALLGPTCVGMIVATAVD